MGNLTYEEGRIIFLDTLIKKNTISVPAAYVQYREDLTRRALSFSIVPYIEFEDAFLVAANNLFTQVINGKTVKAPIMDLQVVLASMIKFYNVQVTFDKNLNPIHYC